MNILKSFTVLDSFRGIAAILVFFYHLQHAIDSIILNNVFTKGCYLFVDFFFIISGFVITHNYRNKIYNTVSFKLYIEKRFYRLYPLHLTLLLMFLIYYLLRIAFNFSFDSDSDYTFIGFLSNVFLLNSVEWHSKISSLTWNLPSWSVSAEVISYIIFGASCLIQNKLAQKVLILLMMIVSYKILYDINNSFSIIYTYNFGFLRGIFGFFLGFFVYQLYLFSYKSSIYNKVNTTIAEIVLILGCISLLCLQEQLQHLGYIYYILFFFVVYMFSLEKGFISKIIRRIKFLEVLGKISYSVYINHYFLIIIFSIIYKKSGLAVINNFYLNFLVILLETATLICLSKFSYHFIELRFKTGPLNGIVKNNSFDIPPQLKAKKIFSVPQSQVR